MRLITLVSSGVGLFLLISNAFSQNIIINEAMSSNSNSLRDYSGGTPDWIEIFNDSDSLAQLAGMALSDDDTQPHKWIFPELSLAPYTHLLIFASGKNEIIPAGFDSSGAELFELHTNFKISSEGEALYLYAKDTTLQDSLLMPPLDSDESFGRWAQSTTHIIFTDPTPGKPNTWTAGAMRLADPKFILSPGFYNAPLQLAISHSEKAIKLRYTDNGSPPTNSSKILTSPLSIDRTTVIRMQAFLDDSITSNIVTGTFFIGEETQLPVVSLSTDRENFYGWWRGIYIKGPNAEPEAPYYGANFWQDWERPIQVELFENNGERAFSIAAGVKIFGNYTRSFPMKSLAIFLRKKYGPGKLNYPLFPDKDIQSFESFLLRNAGNDWKKAYMRDAVMHELMKGIEVNRQAYRPAIVFLNGEYLGIHNIREKINKHYIAANYGVNPDSLDLLAENHVVQEGSDADYVALINFVKQNDLQLDHNYDYAATQMDMENYARYNAVEIYSANSDWPMVNIKYWRVQNGGKWRWLLYDLDSGLSAYGTSQPYSNTLRGAIVANSLFPWSTTLFKNVVRNKRFQTLLFNYMADYLNSIFLPERIDSVVTRLQDGLENDIGRHKYDWSASAVDWWGEVRKIRDFARERPAYVRQHFIDRFGLPGEFQLAIEPASAVAGEIQLNSLDLQTFPWQGIYFADVPVQLRAMPQPGYRFAGWENPAVADSSEITLIRRDEIILHPKFEALDLKIANIQINEINFSDKPPYESGDWIELVNPTDSTVSLAGWIFQDNNTAHAFPIPAGTEIKAQGFVILTTDSAAFRRVYGQGIPLIGDFDFGLSADGDHLRIIHPSGVIADSLSYLRQAPWPQAGTRQHFTYELQPGAVDNSHPGNWQISAWLLGSPGAENSDFSTPTPKLRFSEYFYAGGDSLGLTDWFELFNAADSSISLEKWKIVSENGLKIHTLPPGLEIGPNEFVVFCRDTIQMQATFPWLKDRLALLPFSFDASGGRISLHTLRGRSVDTLLFNLAMQPDLNAYTHELKNETEPDLSEKNWQFSRVAAGTPGLPNSISGEFQTGPVINEIYFADSLQKDPGLWIEIFNTAKTAIDLQGWSLQNPQLNARHFFPQRLQINAGEYLVLTADATAFASTYPQVSHFAINEKFNLRFDGDQLLLRDAHSLPADSVYFGNGDGWPEWQTGISFELKNDSLDNSLSTNWQISAEQGGTPGRQNSLIPAGMLQQTGTELPDAFRLFPNYPNPFNPATNIRIDLPERSEIRLDVYNILGQRIETIFTGNLDAGEKEFQWRPSEYRSEGSGVYILRFQAVGQRQKYQATRKMLLLK